MQLELGVTGTRNGMTKFQESNLEKIIETLIFEKEYDLRVLHQGQCVGVDVEVAKFLKRKFNFYIISHPPIKTDLIGICENDEKRQAKSYFSRNRDIVNESNLLLVIPAQNSPQAFGGTWYTHDYARENKKPYIILYPDGRISYNVN